MDSAVRKGFLTLSSKLQTKYSIQNIDGAELINAIFGQKGISKLEFKDKEGIRSLLSGMFSVFRNNYMHTLENTENNEISIILMINTLILMIDKLE